MGDRDEIKPVERNVDNVAFFESPKLELNGE